MVRIYSCAEDNTYTFFHSLDIKNNKNLKYRKNSGTNCYRTCVYYVIADFDFCLRFRRNDNLISSHALRCMQLQKQFAMPVSTLITYIYRRKSCFAALLKIKNILL